MGVPHDGIMESFDCPGWHGYIMATTLRNDLNSFQWSNCSLRYFHDFFRYAWQLYCKKIFAKFNYWIFSGINWYIQFNRPVWCKIKGIIPCEGCFFHFFEIILVNYKNIQLWTCYHIFITILRVYQKFFG